METRLTISILLLALCSCAPTVSLKSPRGKARVTFYSRAEDKWHDRIAMTNKLRAKEGVTVAAERSFPFGTRVAIPALAGIVGDGSYVVQDRGGAVEKRKASTGAAPVFDVYVASDKRKNWLGKFLPEYMEYETN